jgi:putative Holliday junction resolvase
MRILAVDWGKARLGIALSDEMGIIASPYDVITNDDELHTRLADIIRRKKVDRIVVGLPITLSGTESEAAKATRVFADTLAENFGLPVELFDERMTTRAAERAMRESGAKEHEVKKRADAVAAALLLDTYLKYIGNQDDRPTTEE